MRVAVLLPCFNEALTIGKVVADFRRELPDAYIYVYDNNSTDDTAAIARAAGAIVVREKRQGKGFVVASMLEQINADVYVMADGDDTYPADKVHELIRPVVEQAADMVVGNRLVQYGQGSFRPLHVLGNRVLGGAVNQVFHSKLKDIMSGYRAFNRAVAKGVPILSRGFEVETEFTLQVLYRDFVIGEVPVPYGERPEGSFSKLRTYRDGFRVLIKIIDIYKAYRPMFFFSFIGGLIGLLGLALGAIPVTEFVNTGRVDRFPTAILAAAMEIVAIVTMSCGLVLDGVNHRLKEVAQLVQKTTENPRRGLPDQQTPD